jgi:predicted DNA-binding ribbon-helix-helix protein
VKKIEKRKRNKRNSFIETKVVGLRAELSFWEMCEKKAKSENTTRNNLIISVVSEYCGGVNGK